METHITCTAEGSGTSTPPSGQPRGGFTRSCTTCRSRKVKCDKQQPCAQCVRSGVDCVYPPGPGRAPKRPRKERDVQLLNRLSRLESIIKALDKDNNSRSNPPRESAEGTDHVRVQDRTGSESERSRSESPPIDKQLGRLMIADSRSYYVSSVLWANLSDEIEELRDLLHQPTSDDETPMSTKSPAADSSSLEIGSNAMLLGFRSLAQSLNEFHPQISVSVALLEVFKQNVAPLVRIFHIPTLIKLYWDAVSSLDSPDKNTEALLFTIYYSAIISMDSEQCVSILGVDRPTALERYLFATQQALARADLLNTENLVLLQAAVLFLSALRNEDDSRRVWSLTALVYHIAQAMGLHRDGPAFGLGPFETELRRRLWWHICLLDNRSSDYHGCEPIVHESLFDTKIPLNINDSDITPEMTEPPPEREGATEMTFCLIRFHSMRVMWKIGNIPPSKEAASDQRLDGQKHALTLEDCEALVDGLNQKLQDQFIRHCDLSIPFYLVSVTVARLIIARSWLMVHYPRSRKDCLEAISSETLRDKLFLTSVQVLEMSSFLMTNKDLRRWRWHSQTHFQWHALAFVLLEICRRPPSPDCDRAWAYVSTVYSQWNMRESHKKYAFWRPVQRLMAKAQYVREIQSSTMASLASYSQTAGGQSDAQPSGLNATLWPGSIQDPGAPGTGNALQPPADGDSVLTGASPLSGDGKDQSLYSLMELDSLIDMFPETEGQNFVSLTGQDGVLGSV